LKITTQNTDGATGGNEENGTGMGSDGDEMSDVSVEESKDSFLDTFINFEKEI
jgi:hypothetical protein